MLLTKEVEMKWNQSTKKYYKSKGYEFTKYGDVFIVKINDVTPCSHVLVTAQCDNCGEKVITTYLKYNQQIHENKYYCNSCTQKLFTIKHYQATRLKNGKSFEQWCLDNNRQDILDRWDYELNNCNPKDISYGTNTKYYFKCQKGIHHSELKKITNFISGQEGSIKCHACNSFAQWGTDNICLDFLEKYWDYEKNVGTNPWEIDKNSKIKVYIKCQEHDYHESYKISCANFYNSKRCPYCASFHGKVHPLDSFAQYHIDHTDKNFLVKYWSNKNTINPWKISVHSVQKIWIKCQEKDYHEDYLVTPDAFFSGTRCPYCSNYHGKVHILDSLGTLYPEVFKIWSSKNKKSPYEYSPYSHNKVFWKCPEEKHEEYLRRISYSVIYDFRCPKCSINSRKGINNTSWKGGISKINSFLRGSINEWKRNSLINGDYCCDITGLNKNIVLHHIYGFNLIVKEVFEETKLPVHQKIEQYTQEELDLLSKTCLSLHYKHGFGMCMDKELHKIFHELYGRGDNTPEQYKEFKYKYQNKLL